MKKLVEIFPLVAAFLIFNGFLKLYIFYGHWGIRIIDYLDLSEILLSFLNDINIILLCALVFIFHQLVGISIIGLAYQKTTTKKSFVEYIEDLYPSNKTVVIVTSLILATLSGLLFFYYNNLIWVYALTAFLAQALLIFIDKTNLSDEPIVYGITMAMIFITFTFCLAFREVKAVEHNTGKTITRIETETEIIRTTSSKFLIGKTHNFIYLFDRQKNCSEIIPVDKIKKIETYR